MTLVARAGLGVAATIVVIAALPPAVTTSQEPTAGYGAQGERDSQFFGAVLCFRSLRIRS